MVQIVAEPGSTAAGNLDAMRRLITLAADLGADIFKAQWTSSPAQLCARRRASSYLDAYRLIAWPIGWHEQLRKECEAVGLEYACTVYLPQDVVAVNPFVQRHKLSSFEAMDVEMREAVWSTGKPAVISTGMMTEEDVMRLADALGADDWMLACTSSYPCPPEAANLGSIAWLRTVAPSAVGYSDHCREAVSGALAVAVGARMVEFHYRLDACDPNNADYAVSRSPSEAKEYVNLIRLAETMLGSGIKEPQPAEVPMRAYRVGRP